MCTTTKEGDLDIEIENFENYKLIEHIQLYSDDLKSVNSKDKESVSPSFVKINEDGTINLKKHSWNMLRYKILK